MKSFLILVRYLFLLAAIGSFVGSFWVSRQYQKVPANAILPQTKSTPEQLSVQPETRTVELNKRNYQLKTRFSYQLSGLVVATTKNTSWNNLSLDFWHPIADPIDLCVIWGKNAKQAIHLDMQFASEDYSCFPTSQLPTNGKVFDPTALSDNHIIAQNESLMRQIRTTKVGDQISLSGFLVDMTTSDLNGQNVDAHITSTARTDDLAEVVFVETFNTLQHGYPPYDLLIGNLNVIGLIFLIVYFVLVFIPDPTIERVVLTNK